LTQALINVSEFFLAENKRSRWGYFGLPFYFLRARVVISVSAYFSISTAGDLRKLKDLS
jgi:hypothetical protein